MKQLTTILVLSTLLLLLNLNGTTHAESPIRPGDHVAIVGNTFADQLRMHGYLETMLLQHWPADPVSVRNLGWGGDMLTARDRPTGFPTEESTLRAHQTDVIVACFGMGESFAGEMGLADFQSNLRAFIQAHMGKSYNGHSPVRLILVSPISYEDLGELTPAYQRRNDELLAYSGAMGQVAAAAQVPFVDLYQPSRYLMDEPSGPNLTTNGIHLNPFGYWAISYSLYRGLVGEDQGTSSRPWQILIDGAAGVVSTRGVKISGLTLKGDALSFEVQEQTGPTLPPPTDQDIPPQLQYQRDMLTVANLESGNYRLTVAGELIVTADHTQWAEGVAIDASPAHQAAEAFRQAVNDKNMQFAYSWKALNQVHIVGERRSSPSGRALPDEVIEFKNIADQVDSQLGGMMELKTRPWRLERSNP